MPTFSYKGYDFEVDHTPSDEEFSQMSAYVDTLPAKEAKKEKREATWGEALKQGFGQVGNTADLALSTLAGGAAALFGDQQNALDIEEQRLARKASRDQWGSPDEAQQTMPQKVVNALMPTSIAGAGLSPVDTVSRAKGAGETTSNAYKAGAIDAAGNVAGMILPGFKQGSLAVRAGTGFGANAAQDYATKLAIQQVLETEEGKRQFTPTLEDAAISGLVGGAVASAGGRAKPQKPSTKLQGALADLKKPIVEPPKAQVEPEQMKLFDQFEERSPISPYQTEMAPDMWRTDENGIPIRADLSMEVQNLQQPLQRNLFGDELDVNFPRDPNLPLNEAPLPVRDTDLEVNSKPLTQAIDEMPQLPWESDRDVGINLLKHEMPASPELKVARMDADAMMRNVMEASGDNLKGFNAKMKKQRGSVLIGGKKVEVVPTEEGFVATIGGKEVGYLRSNITPEQRAQLGEDASVDMVKVDPELRGQGIGKALYEAWTKANEGNVIPSGKTSKDAWATWNKNNTPAVDKFINQEAQRILGGADPQMVIGNITDPSVAQRVQARATLLKKQGGGLKIDWSDEPSANVMAKVPGIREKLSNFIPTTMTADETVNLAKTKPDVDQNMAQKAVNYFTKGGLYQAEKTNNPIVKFTVDKLLNADRLARADIRDYIHDSLAPAMRDLSTSERTEIATLLNEADMMKSEVTPEFLSKHGFSEKQIAFAEAHKQTMDAAFERINAARAAAGKDPIDRRVAYSAMNATGDFRKRVYVEDEDGAKVLVGIVGAKTKWGLASIEKEMKAKHPEYIIETQPRYLGSTSTDKAGSTVTAIQQALEMLSENSPATKEFLEVLNDIKTKEAYDYRGTNVHTKAKKGVFGMEGRKPWLSAEQNAKDFMDAQLQYAEAALKWGHLSEATREVNKVLSSDVDMPNAKKWSEGYMRNALGVNPTKAGGALESAINGFLGASGVGHTIPTNISVYSRKAVNTMLLGLNPAFIATNIVQPFLSMPAMASFLAGRGVDAGVLGYGSTLKAGFTMLKDKIGKLDAIEQGAKDYADKYHVYGSELVDTSTVSRKNAEFYLDKTGNLVAGKVESLSRQLMYYSFVHMLKDSGMGKDYGLAHNLTDMAMNNYSPIERPTVFNALGPIGDLAANLSSFKHNELSRLAMFAREIGNDKNAAPFLTQIAMSAAAAGITGMLGFQEADWLYRKVTKAMGKPDSLSRVVIDFSEGLTENAKSKYVASHGMFSLLGLDMSKRLGISDVIPDSVAEAAFPGGSKLTDVAGAGLSAMTSPTEMNLKRFAREASPGFATGPMDREWFSNQTEQGELALNRKTLAGQVIRNDADKMAKNWGFTGINESVQKQKLWDLQQQGIGYVELRTAVVNKMVDRLHTGKPIPQEMFTNYAKYEGDGDSLVTELTRKVKAGEMSAVDAAKLRAMSAKTIPQQAQGQRVMEAFQ